MREIPMKKVKVDLKEITGEGREVELDYAKTLMGILNSGFDKGVSIEDIEVRLKLRKLLSEADDKVMLEDEDYKYLLKLVKAEKWRLPAQEILDFVKDVEQAKAS